MHRTVVRGIQWPFFIPLSLPLSMLTNALYKGSPRYCTSDFVPSIVSPCTFVVEHFALSPTFACDIFAHRHQLNLPFNLLRPATTNGLIRITRLHNLRLGRVIWPPYRVFSETRLQHAGSGECRHPGGWLSRLLHYRITASKSTLLYGRSLFRGKYCSLLILVFILTSSSRTIKRWHLEH